MGTFSNHKELKENNKDPVENGRKEAEKMGYLLFHSEVASAVERGKEFQFLYLSVSPSRKRQTLEASETLY